MPERRRAIELSAERPAGTGPAGTVARLTTRWEVGPDGAPPSPEELRAALHEMRGTLDTMLGPPLAAAPLARPDRDLRELIETYRPRQPELVDLLRDEGELTPTEHVRLRTHLAGGSSSEPPSRGRPPVPVEEPRLPYADRPIASAPIEAGAPAPPGRPVPELLRVYEITSLKQAGAVRARRQISFAEYMALKRHFEGAESGATDGSPESRGRKPG